MVLVNVKERRIAKKIRKSGDPDGVLAVLQTARRLLMERGDKAVYPALGEACELAAPKDRARAWWGAHRQLVKALPDRNAPVGEWLWLSEVQNADVLEWFATAIRNQGMENIAAAKGKRP